jgi:MoaA/NifB/PqqE/SkfB family radical SAM enzyme
MGLRRHIPRKNRMTLQNYMELVTPLNKYLFQVFLYNWSEPFLNKEIYDIISFNTKNNIATLVSTNLNVSIDPVKLINSGLNHLVISADGITQDIYEKYRRGGKIEKVFSNLKLIVDTKQKLGSNHPYIEWQCLVTKHNENHLSQIKQTALSKGVNEVRFGNLNFYSVKNNTSIQKEWLPKDPDYHKLAHIDNKYKKKHKLRKPCFWLWRTAILNADGGITPCCLYDTPNWGNAFDNDFISIWNNITFQEARLRSQNDKSLHTKDLICDQCTAPFIYK